MSSCPATTLAAALLLFGSAAAAPPASAPAASVHPELWSASAPARDAATGSGADHNAGVAVTREIALFAAWAAAMALIFWAYLAISRKAQRMRDETLRALAVPLPVAAVTFRFPGSVGCSHFTIGGNVMQASCGICGLLGGDAP